MDGHTFLSWNITNLVTVVLMVALGALVFVAAQRLWKNKMGA